MKVYLNQIFVNLPKGILTNQILSKFYKDWDSSKIQKKTGISNRFISSNNETALDISIPPSKLALDLVSSNNKSIEYLIYVSQTNDYLFPGNATLLLNKLNLNGIPSVDVNQGCSGYIYGLNIAYSLIKSRQANCILLVTGDTYSKLIHPLDKSVRTLFGDGASATIVSNYIFPNSLNFEILNFSLGSDGKKAESLYIKDGGSRNPITSESFIEKTDKKGYIRNDKNLFMNGEDVFNFTIDAVPKNIIDLLNKSNLYFENIKYFYLHQANKFILEFIGKKMEIQDKLIIDLENTGNTTSSSIPILINSHLKSNTLNYEDLIILCGFGVGLSWGSALLKKI
jgi:3-oxoacyl-[acyl-carrier-protein] synthase-3